MKFNFKEINWSIPFIAILVIIVSALVVNMITAQKEVDIDGDEGEETVMKTILINPWAEAV